MYQSLVHFHIFNHSFVHLFNKISKKPQIKKKGVKMMYEEYQDLFYGIKRNNPESYPEEIKNYVINMKRIVNSNNLVRLAILVSFKEERQQMQDIFENIYKKYGMTNFEGKNLKESDIQCICDEYMMQVEQIAKEVTDVFKKDI